MATVSTSQEFEALAADYLWSHFLKNPRGPNGERTCRCPGCRRAMYVIWPTGKIRTHARPIKSKCRHCKKARPHKEFLRLLSLYYQGVAKLEVAVP